MAENEIIVVAGARPNFMKVAPLCRALRADGTYVVRLVHTGQHYDPVLSDQIMRDLELPEPQHHLGVGSASPSIQLAKILEAMDEVLIQDPPQAVVVVGDVTSTLAAALAAANRSVPVVHVEAGLRSRDWTMPEERNRVLVDRLSGLLFVTEPSGVDNLRAEGVTDGVHLVGNVMIDSLRAILPRAAVSDVQARLGLEGKKYSVLTLHRPSNVDDTACLDRMLQSLAPVAVEAPLVFPVHPRTRARLKGLSIPAGLMCVDPMGYTDFIGLVSRAALTLTDSGGLQEETTVLGVPCLTLRKNTERPITVEIGSNVVVGDDAVTIRELGQKALAGEWKQSAVPDNWDGNAAARIVEILVQELA